MDKDFEELWAAAKNISLDESEKMHARDMLSTAVRFDQDSLELSEDERLDVRNFLRAFILAHPADRRRFSFYGMCVSLLSLRVSALVVLVMFLVTTGGAAAYASDSALPGDTLYPIKVGIMEPLRGRFAFGREAKAMWAGDCANRRLQEAESLMLSADFDEERRALLEERFTQHLARMEEHLASMGDSELEEQMLMHLENNLQRHEELMRKLQSGSLDEADVVLFLQQIRRNRQRIGRHGQRPGGGSSMQLPPPGVVLQL